MDAGNLEFTVPGDRAQAFRDWFVDDVVNRRTGDKKTASVELLEADLKTTALTLTAKNVQIFSLRDVYAGNVHTVEVECMVDQWSLDAGK